MQRYENIKVKEISEINIYTSFFHYTNKLNIESIVKKGLVPKIGDNAIGVELTEKIFFAVGAKGVFSILDSWIRWLIAKRLIDLPGEKMDIPFYRFCTFVMRLPIIRHIVAILVNFIVWVEFHIPFFKKKSFKIMRNILENSVFFVLDLKEGEDFSYQDIDEVKSQKFNRKLLKQLYAKSRRIDSKKMDFWNMHTFTGKEIAPNKVTLVKIKDSDKALDIILYFVHYTNYDLKVLAPFFNDFLKYYHYL